MSHVCILSTSLSERSKSQLLAELLRADLDAQSISNTLVDLREMTLPLAGQPGAWDHPQVDRLSAAIGSATHIVFSAPIYCYDLNAAAKNVIELAGRAFTGKVVGFICTAGGASSYMSVMGFANHLMLDFRSVIVPRFLYVTSKHWNADLQLDPEISKRLKALPAELLSIQVADPEATTAE